MKTIIYKSDITGAIASILCLMHCVLTPIFFITYGSSCHTETPLWWNSIDILFLIISFFAILKSTQTTSSQIIKLIFWINWIILSIIIINEKLEWIPDVSENYLYFTAIFLAIIHMYNLKYCQCKDEDCCVHTK